jgi:hypothetical protein
MDIRTMRVRLGIPLLLLAVTSKACLGQTHTDRGALLGGVTGALAGAGIGKHNDETAAGALIGGAVGLLTGATLGNAMDERDRRAWEAQYYAQQQRARQYARMVSPQDVVSMTRNGVSPDVIITQIRQYGVQRTLSVQDVISLHQQGVDESVINAMQQAAAEPAPIPARPVVRRPVVVEQYYVEPVPYWHPYYGPRHDFHFFDHHHHHHGHHGRHGVSWGISVHH